MFEVGIEVERNATIDVGAPDEGAADAIKEEDTEAGVADDGRAVVADCNGQETGERLGFDAIEEVDGPAQRGGRPRVVGLAGPLDEIEVFDAEGNRVGVEIFKDPKTDGGMKKSAKGLTAVYRNWNGFVLKDQATWDEVKNCAFVQVYKDGNVVKRWTLDEVRGEVAKSF